jgi:hypothetical protein
MGKAKGRASANSKVRRPSFRQKLSEANASLRNGYRFFFLAAFLVAFFLVAIG